MKPLVVTLAGFMVAAFAVAQSPVGDWDFTSQADTVRDRGGGGNSLRTEGCEWSPSKIGKCLRIPAKSGRVWIESPSEGLRPVREIGLVAWIRPLGTGQYCAIVSHGSGWGDESTAGYRLLAYLDGARFLMKAGRVINISGGKVIRGQWNQVAATYDGKEAVLFVNGQAVVRDPVQGPIDYAGAGNAFEVGTGDNGNLDGELASLKLFNRALSEADVLADWRDGRRLLLSPDEITAERVEKLERCSLAHVPEAPFERDRHTTMLAHMDTNADADFARWEGRAGGWRLKRGEPGRFGLAMQLPAGSKDESGAPFLYRGAGNCNMRQGSCEFWLRAAGGVDLATDDRDRYLLTILPEYHLGYDQRPGVHLVMRTHAATRSLQFAANTDRIDWYSHLNGAWIADSAKTTLHLPIRGLSGTNWHHVLCSWSMEGEGRIWLIVDGQGVTTRLDSPPGPGPQIPCYKIFLGGSYFPEVYCPSAPAAFDEFRMHDVTVARRLIGFQALSPPKAAIDEKRMMDGEDLCRHFLDFTAALQMGGGWEGVYTWPNLMPDESPGSFAAVAEDEYTMRHITPAFLRAYDVFGDDRYLRVAENCGQMLIRTQDRNGAWCQGYIMMPDGAYPVSPGVGSIEEGTQTDPLRVLFWLWRITGKSAYRDAAVKSAQFVLGGQKPDGAWPLSVNSQSMTPSGGYRGYSTLNDGTTLWAMKAMLMGWHLTQDHKYLESLQRAGGWLISAQLPGKAPGWAEQYRDGEPAWAREFEPPAACISAIDDAADALLLMFDLTADERYLTPLRKCVRWGSELPQQHKGYLYYDPQTGEPIAARGYKITRFSEPAFAAASPYRTSTEFFNQFQAQLTARTKGALVPSTLGPMPRGQFENRSASADLTASNLERIGSNMEAPLAHLSAFRRGEFPAGNILNEHPRHGRHFWPGRGGPDVQQILDYIHVARVIAGEMEPASFSGYGDDYFGAVDPTRDWYKTPMLR